jgi:hypothetical protein
LTVDGDRTHRARAPKEGSPVDEVSPTEPLPATSILPETRGPGSPESAGNEVAEEAVASDLKTHDIEVFRAFRDYGLEAAKWHRDRGEGHERRAATLLGFVAATLALLGNLATPLAKIENPWFRGFGVGFAAGGVVCLIASGIFAARALSIISYKVTSPDWVIERLDRYIKEYDLAAVDAVGTFARSYVGRSVDHSMQKSLSDNATRRGTWSRISIRLLLGGISCISVTVLILLLNGALNPTGPTTP